MPGTGMEIGDTKINKTQLVPTRHSQTIAEYNYNILNNIAL